MVNCRRGYGSQVILVADGARVGGDRRRWRRVAAVANDALPADFCICVCPILDAPGSLVARPSSLWAVDRQLAPRRQHRSQVEANSDDRARHDASDHMVVRHRFMDRRLPDCHPERRRRIYPDAPGAVQGQLTVRN